MAQSLSQGPEFLMPTQALQWRKGKALTGYVVDMHVHKEMGGSSHLERKPETKKKLSLLESKRGGHCPPQRASKGESPEAQGNWTAELVTWKVALEPVGPLLTLATLPEPELLQSPNYIQSNLVGKQRRCQTGKRQRGDGSFCR